MIKIISEIGINHNGDIELAKKMIEESKNAGADLVKFQKRDINLVYSKEILDQKRESPWGTTNREQKIGLEFGKKEYDEIDSFCKRINIINPTAKITCIAKTTSTILKSYIFSQILENDRSTCIKIIKWPIYTGGSNYFYIHIKVF